MTRRGAPGPAGAAGSSGWPVRRAPRWLLAAAAVLAGLAVLVGLAHRPTNGQRAVDLHGLIRTLNFDIESCAGGVRESLTALHAIQAGTSHDLPTAISIARDSAANCSPASNQLLADLIQYEVPESLTRFGLPATVNKLVTWAFPWGQRVARDIADVLSARRVSAREKAATALQADRSKLDALRAQIDGALSRAARSLGSSDSPPRLPG
jgi:hypothetical protein